jgi:hypothetical protein
LSKIFVVFILMLEFDYNLQIYTKSLINRALYSIIPSPHHR